MDATSAGMIGKYQVIRILGRGGMGEVLLAQDDLGRRVAIKRPFKSALEDGLARFKVEARAATLSHPNIPVVYEMGTQDGLPFIAMEFVEGDPLDKIIASGKPLDLITKLSVIEQVCAGLGCAHQKGIIHRDIKPANVILQPNGIAKIIDFGIAKITNLEQTSGLTQTSQIIGSLHYIAPERFKGEAVDGRVDIFSAGVILYLLLTGHLPFAGGEATASYRIVNEKHSSLAEHIHDYPPALDAILDEALAKNPDDRYSTAEDFGDALHEVIEELKKSRVFQLFDDAERLTTESRFAPALELLDEALKLDPANTQVRKLRRLVRDRQKEIENQKRLREIIARADDVLAVENYTEALNLLREAERLDGTFTGLREKIQFVDEKRKRFEKSAAALADAEATRARGDLTAALRIIDRALQENPEHSKLLAVRGTLARQLETEALQGKVLELLDAAHRELAAQHYPATEQLLLEAAKIDASHPRIEELRNELARVREQEKRRLIVDEVHRRVNEFLRSDDYNQATELLNLAIDKLPTEPTLQRLKVDVDTGARKYGAKRFVDGAISAARDLFASAPLEALASLQKAIEQMPDEERLISYERTLRQQLDAIRVEQVLADSIRKARELIATSQYDKAIDALEAYHLEYGSQRDIDDLLALAKNEQANQQRRSTVERTTSAVRALVDEERLEDAIRLLDTAIRETGDAGLSRLFEEVREKQGIVARKLDVVQKRVALLRERGDLAEAVQVLNEYLAATPKSPQILALFKTLQAELEQKRTVSDAIAAARQAVQRHEFTAGLQALQAVARAYGESPELTRETQQAEAARSSFAQEEVSKSIEAARAALLKSDANGALAVLKAANEWVGYDDEQRQTDWKRIGQAAKAALLQPDKPVTLADLDEPIVVRRKTPVWAIAAAGLGVIAIVIASIVLVTSHKPPPPGQSSPLLAHIVIFKAPPGAMVAVDSLTPAAADAKGEISVPVKPGKHHIKVSKDGFAPFEEDISLEAGETDREPAILTSLGNSGTLIVQGNPTPVKIFVDGVSHGFITPGKPIVLEAKAHMVRYSAPNFEDSAEHSVTIKLNAETTDNYNLTKLAPPPPSVGHLIIETNAGAHISIDSGQHSGVANASGTYEVDLTPGKHFIDASLDGFVSIKVKEVDVPAGKNVNANAQLAPLQPTLAFFKSDQPSIEDGQSVTLSWKVDNASSVAIDPIGSVQSAGSRSFSPDQTTTYKLTANGNLPLMSLTVTVRPKAKPQPTPPTPEPVVQVTPKVEPPDAATLKAVLNASYMSVFSRASGKSAKDCKTVLNEAGGALNKLSGWCEAAKRFDVTEKCGDPEGTDTAASMRCSEDLTITPKDGDPQRVPTRRTFHFVKGSDGAWKLAKWE